MDLKNWSVTEQERARWVRIENINNWKVKIPNLHPDTMAHTKLWREYSKLCIEGLWGKDFGYYRFMPPKLFFYVNFYTIIHEESAKQRKKIRPLLRDLEWEFAYMFLVAKGFSGFSDDDEYSCNEELIKYNKGEIDKSLLPLSCISLNGKPKKYEDALKYCKRLHDAPKGIPLYENDAKNVMLFGARASVKSYFISGAALHEIIFCGHSRYDEDFFKKRNKIGVCVGAGRSDKSANFIAYMTSAMNEFAVANDLGVWGDISKDDYEPCPFYREMAGEVRSGTTSPWRNEYKVRKDGREVTLGSGSFLRHVNYKDDPEAAASGRYNYNIIEEIGLIEDAPKIWESNEFTTKVGTKFGSNVGLGTSGDIEKVEGAKEIFLKPVTYNLVAYEDLWEHSGQNGMTGFFIPAYMTDRRFKDDNGNTDLERAKKFYFEELEKHKDNPVSFRTKCLHAPLVISHMWTSTNGNLLPVEEAKNREKQLLVKNMYRDLMKPCKLVFNTNSRTGVEIQYDTTLSPIVNPYTTGADEDREGCVVIYKEPETIDGRSYPDQYFYVHDCYARSKNGLSLGVTYVLTNPKYSMYGYGNDIVASYIGRPRKGLDEYNTNMEKLIQLYGNCPRMLWYEANRGSDVRSHFHNKNKAYLLAFEPHYAKGRSAYEQKDAMYGFTVGNKSAKVELINWFNDWLLETMTINGQTTMNIDRIPCMYLIRQIIMFNIDEDENFDGISAMLGFPLALKEFEKTLIVESQKKKGNPLNFLANNPKLIKSLN